MIELGGAMAGDRCRAEPFVEPYRDALRAACAEDRGIWTVYAQNFGTDGFDSSIDHYLADERNRVFVLFDDDTLAGMSSYLGLDQARRVVEIGGTYLRPHLRGTGLNERIKHMMLDRAFKRGIRRVEFRVDSRNEKSQAALEKLGALREGVLRADRITWTGHVRDTVLFAMLAEEWTDEAPSRRVQWQIRNHPERFDFGDVPPDYAEVQAQKEAARWRWNHEPTDQKRN